MKSKRPPSIWFAQTVLMLIALGSGFSVCETYVNSGYSLSTMIFSPTQWFDGLTSTGSLVAFIGLCFRWRFSRWLAFIVLSVIAVMATYEFFRAGPLDSISVVSSLLGGTMVILPLVILAGWLLASKRVRVFFGVIAPDLPENSLPLPPPPPTFES